MDSVQNARHNPHHAAGILQQTLPDRLSEVLRRALVATGGNGGAIALMHKNVMVTCARAGCAPDLGSEVNLNGSFAGLCVRTGRTLRSDHLETDPRVNGAAWRALNVASMIATPVRHGDAIVGVLAVFSHESHAFVPSHGVALEILALVLDATPPPRPPAHHDSRHLPRASKNETPAPPSPAATQKLEARTPLDLAAKREASAPQRPPHDHARRAAETIRLRPLDAAASPALKPEPLLPSPVAAAPPEPRPVAPSSPPVTKKVETPHILRFHKSERMLHWSIAIPFLVCFATGIILVMFYNPHPQRAYRFVFSWLHRISGACLMLFPALTALRNRDDHSIHFYNIKEAFTWIADDVKWLFLMGAAAISSKVSLPEQGKFNAAEKLNFIMVLCTYPLFIASGLTLWGLHVPVAAWILHVGMAAMAAPLVMGHIFMATINPETRVGLSGMLTGYVDRHWARHHYTRWYRQHFEQGHGQDGHHEAKYGKHQAPLVQYPSEAQS